MTETTLNQTKEAIEQYDQDKPENDIDLIQTVRDILINVGLGPRLSDAFDSSKYIIDAIGRTSDIQRFLLNRYWELQLMSHDGNTMEERYCLIPNGTTEEWITLFKTKIVPFILDNNLPRVI